jgi:H+-transporting ATPase
VFTQVVAIAMCAAGWLVEPIFWTLIAAIRIYNIAWMFLMGSVRQVTELFANHRTARHLKSVNIVNRALRSAA